jgi:hypothetical protein
MGVWRAIYYYCGIYEWYPEKISDKDIKLKTKMLEELKEIFEENHKFYYKLQYNSCVLQLQLTNKSMTFDDLIKKNILLL